MIDHQSWTQPLAEYRERVAQMFAAARRGEELIQDEAEGLAAFKRRLDALFALFHAAAAEAKLRDTFTEPTFRARPFGEIISLRSQAFGQLVDLGFDITEKFHLSLPIACAWNIHLMKDAFWRDISAVSGFGKATLGGNEPPLSPTRKLTTPSLVFALARNYCLCPEDDVYIDTVGSIDIDFEATEEDPDALFTAIVGALKAWHRAVSTLVARSRRDEQIRARRRRSKEA